jgi:predicted AAA+ superfamily ATPase
MEYNSLRTVLIDQYEEFNTSFCGIKRTLPPTLKQQLDAPEISIITGVRRCGKSTLLRQIAQQVAPERVHYFLDLESPFFQDTTIKDLDAIWKLWLELWPPEDKKIVVYYDEIQLVPSWERWVRHLAKSGKCKVFVTGSNSNLLSSELASTLTGRHYSIHLTPLTLNEVLNYLGDNSRPKATHQKSSAEQIMLRQTISRLLRFGSFPRSFIDQSTELLPLYYADIVTRDIIKRRKIRHSAILLKLGDLLCKENTRLFNRQKTSALLGIKDNQTMSNYCEYFKECYLFDEIRAFSGSLRKQFRSLSKFYCVDPTLAMSVAENEKSAFSAAFENLAYNELNIIAKNIGYWHSKQGYEVDFVIEYEGSLNAIQVAYAVDDETTLNREVRALVAAKQELDCKRLIIITAGDNYSFKTDDTTIEVISADQISML